MKYKTIFLFIIIIIFFCCNNKKENNIYGVKNDSVEKYLKLISNNDFSNDKKIEYNKKAFDFIDLKKNDTVTLWYLYNVSRNAIYFKDSFEYKKANKIHYEKSIHNKDTLNLARYYRIKGWICRYDNNLDSAYYFYSKSEKLLKNKNYLNELFNVYVNKCSLLSANADYLREELYASKALLIAKQTKNFNDLHASYELLAIANHHLRKYKEAIGFDLKAYKIEKENNIFKNKKITSNSLNNIGNSFKDLGNFERAIYYFNKAIIRENKEKNDPLVLGFVYSNLSYIFLKQKKYQKAKNASLKSIKILEDFKRIDDAAISKIYLAQSYKALNINNVAISTIKEAICDTNLSKNKEYYMFALFNASSIDKDNAIKYFEEYSKLNDSLLFQERKNRSLFHKIELETDIIENEKNLAISQKWLYLLLSSSILLIVILLFVVFYQKSKKKELLLLNNQQIASQEIFELILKQHEITEEVKSKEKKRIALELHDNIMNKLASTRFNLFTLSKKTDKEAIDNALIHIEKIKDIEDEIRTITHELTNDYFFEKQSFKSLLEQFIENQNQIFKAIYSLEFNEELNLDLLTTIQKINLYRILQESIHNINNHSLATTAIISILKEEETILVSIQDNGLGFNTSLPSQGIGLKNIKKRVATINGKITIQSSIDKGTNIFIAFPL